MNTGSWDIRLWRYTPTVIRVDSSRIVKLLIKVTGGNNTRFADITVQDAIKQFSGPNNWTNVTHDNLEIVAAMDEVDVPGKVRSAVFQFINHFQTPWLTHYQIIGNSMIGNGHSSNRNMDIRNNTSDQDIDLLLNNNNGNMDLSSDNNNSDNNMDKEYIPKGILSDNKEKKKKKRDKKKAKKRRDRKSKREGLSEEEKEALVLLKGEEYKEPYEWMVEFIDWIKGNKKKRPNKSSYTRWVRKNKGGDNFQIAMDKYDKLVELLSENVCEYRGLSFYWYKVQRGHSCCYTDGAFMAPAVKRKKKNYETTDNKEKESEESVENRVENQVETRSVDHGNLEPQGNDNNGDNQPPIIEEGEQEVEAKENKEQNVENQDVEKS